ncbi:MAG: helix-turn-helix domain-containing protein [Propionibacteriaceae bacterium]|jgi:excisionase family DNA binding protein|nr:helix-turn-helix domain-containing protein [Propionibacteriaceae bacterium]
MSEALIFEPETLVAEKSDPPWMPRLLDYVRKAGQAGEVVTVTSEPKMMTPAEVGRGLMMSRSTVSRKIAAGEIHSIMVGNRHRIPFQEYRRVWEQTMGTLADEWAPEVEAELFGDE